MSSNLYTQFQNRYLPEFVYGSIDGTVTTFAIVTGALGAHLSVGIVLVLGLANVLADGFSMAAGNYLSEKSEAAQRQEVESRGVTPINTALATFGSFVVVGIIPLAPFLIALGSTWIAERAFFISIILTLIAFVCIGFIRSRVDRERVAKTILETVGVGILAAVISYIVGYLLQGLA